MNSIENDIQEFLKYQPDMKLVNVEGKIILEGKIFVNRIFDNFLVQKYYYIKTDVNKENLFLSDVYELGNEINNYMHKYPDGKLCLSTNIDLLLSSKKSYSLVTFCKDYIESYFFSYEYYCTYGFFPFNDRAHDTKGIISSYADILGINEPNVLLNFLAKVLLGEYKYRGHLPCQCGSGLKTRNCHAETKNFIELINDPNAQKSIYFDFLYIKEALNENKRKAK